MVTNWSQNLVIRDQDHFEKINIKITEKKITSSDLEHAKDRDQLGDLDLLDQDQWSFCISAVTSVTPSGVSLTDRGIDWLCTGINCKWPPVSISEGREWCHIRILLCKEYSGYHFLYRVCLSSVSHVFNSFCVPNFFFLQCYFGGRHPGFPWIAYTLSLQEEGIMLEQSAV